MLQTFATALACYGLWRAWLRWRSESRAVFTIVTAGFAARALAGVALFWISYLRLPILRSLQFGRGLWFFALDANGYLQAAAWYGSRGLVAMSNIPQRVPSPSFVRLVAVAMVPFGTAASIAILLNCAAYLCMAALITKVFARGISRQEPKLVALSFLAFMPGGFLWSLQLLKDAVFVLLLFAFIALCVEWQDRFAAGDRPAAIRAALVLVIAMAVVMSMITGIRWYIAFALWLALPILFAGVIVRAPRRVVATIAALVAMVVLSQVIYLNSHWVAPPFMNRVLRPTGVGTLANAGLRSVEDTRQRFDDVEGATAIEAGPRLGRKAYAPPTGGKRPVPVSVVNKKDFGGRSHRTITLTSDAQLARMPGTPKAKLIAGATATFLPRFLGQALGLVRIGGGRGLWAFAELDTILFDVLIVWSVVFCVRECNRRRLRVSPAFLYTAATLVVLTVPLLYSVSNFGTLFRIRYQTEAEMVLLPLLVARGVIARDR